MHNLHQHSRIPYAVAANLEHSHVKDEVLCRVLCLERQYSNFVRSVIDSSVIDSSVIDSSVMDSSVIDSSVIDSSVIDSSVIDGIHGSLSQSWCCFCTLTKHAMMLVFRNTRPMSSFLHSCMTGTEVMQTGTLSSALV